MSTISDLRPKAEATTSPSAGISIKIAFGHPLGDCNLYTTCEDCAAAGDPFCGWCLLESKLVYTVQFTLC